MVLFVHASRPAYRFHRAKRADPAACSALAQRLLRRNVARFVHGVKPL